MSRALYRCPGCHRRRLLAVAIFRALRVKTKADYLVAGRSLPAVVLVLTLLTSWIGAGSLFAGAENAYKNGFAALWQPAGGWLGLLLIYFIAPRARKFAQFTLPDLLEARYNQAARVLGTIAILFAYVAITSYQFKGGGNVLHLIFPDTVTPELGTYIIAVFVIVTTAMAGMSSVAYMDVAIGSLVTVICIIATPMLLPRPADGAGCTPRCPKRTLRCWATSRSCAPWSFWCRPCCSCWATRSCTRSSSPPNPKATRASPSSAGFWARVLLETLIVAIAVFGSALYKTGEVAAQPYEIIPYTARHGLPALMGALLLGAVFAKVISTASNYLFSPATNLVEDVFVRYIAPGASNKRVLIVLAARRRAARLLGALPGHLRAQHSGQDALRLHHLLRCGHAGGAGGVLLKARDGVGRGRRYRDRHRGHARLGRARREAASSPAASSPTATPFFPRSLLRSPRWSSSACSRRSRRRSSWRSLRSEVGSIAVHHVPTCISALIFLDQCHPRFTVTRTDVTSTPAPWLMRSSYSPGGREEARMLRRCFVTHAAAGNRASSYCVW